MNPPLPLPVLLPSLAAVLAAGLWFSWRGSRELDTKRRAGLLALRGAALLLLAIIALNPGRWESPSAHVERPWLVLLDDSASMAVKDSERTRAEVASGLVALARERAAKAGVPVVVRPFDLSLREPLGAKAAPPPPKGEGSDPVGAVSDALRDADATGVPPAGVLLLSDGRRTAGAGATAFDTAVMRARSRDVAVNTVLLGDVAHAPDLALTTGSRLLTAFPGEALRVPFRLASTGLGPIRATVVLKDDAGKELARRAIDVPSGKSVVSAFELVAPERSGRLALATDVVPGEVRPANNAATVTVRVITSKTRVFLAEGAPYWDSKFLAQLLRRQKHMDVKSVHRVGDNRFFRIDSGADGEGSADKAVFPATAGELARFDLVVFGKNVDGFLTPERIAALRTYVREDGGAVLFARGRAVSGDMPDFAALEPVVWGKGDNAAFRFKPTVEGESSGLFGEALPGADASLWNALPELKEGRVVAEVKPFSRVLAEGVSGGSRFPVLVVRRQGRGVVGLMNGDGLWKWDFYPEARELGNAYEDFWIQLVRWMSSYSEFLPGQDWSLRLSAPRGDSGESVTVTAAYRGPDKDPHPRIRVATPEGVSTLVPAAVTDDAGRRVWKAAFVPASSGVRTLTVESAKNSPEAHYVVPPPATEADDLSPDPAFMNTLAVATKGATLTPETLPAFLEKKLKKAPPSETAGDLVWRSSWATAPVALLLAALLTTEWWLRRRRGLA